VSKDIALLVVDREGERISTLPEANLTEMSWELVEPGSFKFEIHPLSVGAAEIHLVKREVQVWFDTALVHWGVPWSTEGDHNKLTFQCEGVMSLFKKRYVDRQSMDYSSIEQVGIAWDLLSYAQSSSFQANRDLNISAASPLLDTGVPRSPRYNREEHDNILDIVREFPEMNNGFEYSLQLDPAGKQRFWTAHFPRKGSYKHEYKMRWEVGKARNIARFSYSEDGNTLLTHAYVTGGSNGEIKFEGNWEDTAASVEYGVMQEIISDGNEKDVNWLLDRAKKEVNSRKRPKVGAQITSVTSEEMKLGDVVEGDWLPVVINYGRIQVNNLYRVKSVTWDQSGSLTYGFDGEIVAA
jgi:hypothetical protein